MCMWVSVCRSLTKIYLCLYVGFVIWVLIFSKTNHAILRQTMTTNTATATTTKTHQHSIATMTTTTTNGTHIQKLVESKNPTRKCWAVWQLYKHTLPQSFSNCCIVRCHIFYNTRAPFVRSLVSYYQHKNIIFVFL